MNIREKYRGLSKEDLLEKAYELGVGFQTNSGSCSQSTLAALHEVIDIDDNLVRCATTLSGGVASQVVGSCGGLLGGLMALDYFFGRPWEMVSYTHSIPEGKDISKQAQSVAREYYKRYMDKYGSTQCAAIQYQKYGRMFYTPDPDESQKMKNAAAEVAPFNCTETVGFAAKTVLELLIEKNAIEIN